MAYLQKDKVAEGEKQTYTLSVDRFVKGDSKYFKCQHCSKELTQGYFCIKHNLIFCNNCMFNKDEKKVVACKREDIRLPIFKNHPKEDCIFYPVREIFFKQNI